MRHPVSDIALQAYSWFRADGTMTMEEMRQGFDQMAPDPPEDITITEAEVGGVRGRWADAPGAGPAVVLHFHAGGYLMGSSFSHRDFGGRVSRASGARVLLLDYRLAPENKFPAALDDALAAYRALIKDEGVDPAKIVLSGDSAGGGLALATTMVLRDEGDPVPAGVVTISPFCDLAVTGDSIDARAALDPFVSRDGVQGSSDGYLQGADPTDPKASPLYGSFDRFPPMLMHVGTSEVLQDDSIRVAEKARAAGVSVRLEPAYQMTHIYHLFAYDERVPEAQRDIDSMGEFVRSVTG